MRDKRLLLGLPILMIALCGAAPWKSLPPYLLGKWEGITVTDPNGEVIGPVDASDWVCPGGATSSGRVTLQDVPVPPPPDVCLRPAAPNPTSGRTVLNFSLPTNSQVSLVVYGKKGNGPHGAFPVRTLVSQELVAGFHTVAWDGTDDHGVPLSPDIYRVVLLVGDQARWGDIEIQ
jgi:hypothetical protein